MHALDLTYRPYQLVFYAVADDAVPRLLHTREIDATTVIKKRFTPAGAPGGSAKKFVRGANRRVYTSVPEAKS